LGVGPHGLESATEALAAGAALGFIPPCFTEWHAQLSIITASGAKPSNASPASIRRSGE